MTEYWKKALRDRDDLLVEARGLLLGKSTECFYGVVGRVPVCDCFACRATKLINDIDTTRANACL